jgi:hypothetical protein
MKKENIKIAIVVLLFFSSIVLISLILNDVI